MSYTCDWCQLEIDQPAGSFPAPGDKIDAESLNIVGDSITIDDTEFDRCFVAKVGSSDTDIEEHFHRGCVLKMLLKSLTDLEEPDPLPPEDQPA